MFYIKKNSAKSSVQKRRDWRRHDTDALAIILLREAIKSSPILGNHRILYFSFYFSALGEKSYIRVLHKGALSKEQRMVLTTLIVSLTLTWIWNENELQNELI